MMASDKKAQRARYLRQREVEELYINGYSAAEIHTLLEDRFTVAQGTIRNDIVAIRKRWGHDIEPPEIEGAKEKYLASLKSMRRKSLRGWKEVTLSGDRVRGRDFKLAFEIDKEIARITGVELRSDTKTVHLTMERARGYLEKALAIVWSHVGDELIREAILADLKLIDEDSEG
jgi:hypothetical protein